jgi:hypothetical protein
MTADLTLICIACQFPVGDGAGWLRVTYADIEKYLVQKQEQRQGSADGGAAFVMEQILTAPSLISWLAYHPACDPAGPGSAYRIDASQIRTWQQLVRWTAHLMGKNWFPFTNWADLLLEACGEVPDPSAIRQVVAA